MGDNLRAGGVAQPLHHNRQVFVQGIFLLSNQGLTVTGKANADERCLRIAGKIAHHERIFKKLGGKPAGAQEAICRHKSHDAAKQDNGGKSKDEFVANLH
jgi:hypothetical protein